jgi:hypothetical protein
MSDRELDFRAWFLPGKKMYYEIQRAEVNGFDFEHCLYDGEETPSRFIIMQYTGLNDKLGKKIYEGDVVKFLHARKETVLPVCWGIGGWWASGLGWFKDLREIYSKCEVIGNLYENPELVEVSK